MPYPVGGARVEPVTGRSAKAHVRTTRELLWKKQSAGIIGVGWYYLAGFPIHTHFMYVFRENKHI